MLTALGMSGIVWIGVEYTHLKEEDGMNKLELQAELKRNGHTYKTISDLIGISENAFARKMNGQNDFTLSEIRALALHLMLNDHKLKVIFFN